MWLFSGDQSWSTADAKKFADVAWDLRRLHVALIGAGALAGAVRSRSARALVPRLVVVILFALQVAPVTAWVAGRARQEPGIHVLVGGALVLRVPGAHRRGRLRRTGQREALDSHSGHTETVRSNDSPKGLLAA